MSVSLSVHCSHARARKFTEFRSVDIPSSPPLTAGHRLPPRSAPPVPRCSYGRVGPSEAVQQPPRAPQGHVRGGGRLSGGGPQAADAGGGGALSVCWEVL